MPFVRTFVAIVEDGPRAQALLDGLAVRLQGRAVVGRLALPEAVPIIFFDDRPMEEQHVAAVTALNAVDETDGRQPGEWEQYLAVLTD